MLNKNLLIGKWMKNLSVYLVATWFGLGFAPKASGTFGSLGALPLAFILAYYFGATGLLMAAGILFFVGVWATSNLIKNQTNKDPSIVVVDEVVGQLLSFCLVSTSLYHNTQRWDLYLLGFLLFRLFDIYKIGPVKFFDTKMHNAWGVMLDDVFAGIIAAIILYLYNYFCF